MVFESDSRFLIKFAEDVISNEIDDLAAGAITIVIHSNLLLGCAVSPPVNPDVTETTPPRLSYGVSIHQKQPPAKVAVARTLLEIGAAFDSALCCQNKMMAVKRRTGIRTFICGWMPLVRQRFQPGRRGEKKDGPTVLATPTVRRIRAA